DEPSDRIDNAEKHDIGAEGREIVEPALECVADVGEPDLAHRGRRGKRAGMPRRLDGMTGHPELIHGPFDGISDMHVASSPTWVRGGRGAPLWPRLHRAAGHAAAATRLSRCYS